MPEIECGRARKKKNAFVDKRRLAYINLFDVSARLEHVCDGSELEAKYVVDGFDRLTQ